VTDHPAQFFAGGGSRHGRDEPDGYRLGADDLRSPARQPGTFAVGDDTDHPQRGGHKEKAHADKAQSCGDEQPQHCDQRQHSRAEPTGEVFETVQHDTRTSRHGTSRNIAGGHPHLLGH
jgi:hypothetical protein